MIRSRAKKRVDKPTAKERRRVQYNIGLWMFSWEPEVITHYIDV